LGGELRLEISEEGADAERLAALTGYLRTELLQLDVDGVAAPPGGEAPPGARVVGVTAVSALLVALGQSAGGLQSVVSAVRDWLRRGEEADRRVRLKIDGDELELSQASAEDQQRLIELFISRHAAGKTG
jgi:Effector Associated Constant Component 1